MPTIRIRAANVEITVRIVDDVKRLGMVFMVYLLGDKDKDTKERAMRPSSFSSSPVKQNLMNGANRYGQILC